MYGLLKTINIGLIVFFPIFFFLSKTLKTLAVKHLGHISVTKMFSFVLWVQHGVLQDLQ